jgi:hypothetical protein
MTNPMTDPDIQSRPPRPAMAIMRPKAVILSDDTDAVEETPDVPNWELATFLLGMLLGLLLFLLTNSGFAQALTPQQLPADASAELRSMVAQSGAVFAGQVISIHARTTQGAWLSAGSPAAGPISSSMFVEVVFRVEQGIRGPATGSTYTLREWGGLWSGTSLNAGRYRLGQRALIVLYPEQNGLTSPVNGTDGVLPLHGSGSSVTIDLSWIQARLPRAQPIASIASAPVAHPITSIARVTAAPIANRSIPTPTVLPLTASSTSADALYAALRSWTAPQP